MEQKDLITDEKILQAGYVEYTPPPINNEYVTKFFQKCFSDDMGKKYYIDIKRWDFPPHPYTSDPIPTSYEFEVQFNTEDDRVMDLTLFSRGWTIENAEEFVEEMWQKMNLRYYEKWWYN